MNTGGTFFLLISTPYYLGFYEFIPFNHFLHHYLIFYPKTVTAHPLGQQTFINVDDCPLIIEVKSNATVTDLKKTNQNFNIIKQLSPNHQPICGLFCYNVALEKNKILKRFGFSYDDDLDAWTQMENSPLYYSSIDFMMHLATSHEKECRTEEQYFIQKNSEGTYQNELDFPILKFLIRTIEHLNINRDMVAIDTMFGQQSSKRYQEVSRT